LIAAVTLFRIWAAAHLPLNNDEMYYWIWSRHPAYGYADHPPVVAWLIGATSFLGKSPLAIRSASILCLGLAAIAIRQAAITIGGSVAAAETAAILFVLIPEPELFMAQALPNPPYLLFWALSLLFAARLATSGAIRDAVLLGVALAGVSLSRVIGLVLVAGVVGWGFTEPAQQTRRALWIALVTFAVLYAPFIWWNATHDWWNLRFTLYGRPVIAQTGAHLESVHSLRFLVYAAMIIGLTWLTARFVRGTLLAWTILPLVLVLTVAAFVKNVETYWLLGPCASLCIGLGAWLAIRRIWRVAVVAAFAVAAIATMAAMVDAALTRGGPLYDRDFVWMAEADAVRRLNAGDAVTDTYELAAPLAFNGIPVTMIGTDPQAAQWQSWYGSRLPNRALIITLTPLADDPGTAASMHSRYAHVTPCPTLTLRPSPTSFATFYTACASGAY
jgi:4-amino-4-deoxy-L-arabinose transferase-like glycosyltransferase